MMTGSLMPRELKILLADDDNDDCLLFKDALEELQLETTLTSVHDGEQLMKLLIKKSDTPYDVLFLDLKMPRKNGFACLEEIKTNARLNSLPVIIFSTSYDQRTADLLYKNGAHYYICKPHDFSDLRKVIQTTIVLVSEKNVVQSGRENFYVGV
jgi:CheY-like chemotaxis protein